MVRFFALLAATVTVVLAACAPSRLTAPEGNSDQDLMEQVNWYGEKGRNTSEARDARRVLIRRGLEGIPFTPDQMQKYYATGIPERIANGEIRIGDPAWLARIAWGLPSKIRRESSPAGETQIWEYGGGSLDWSYIHVRDNEVVWFHRDNLRQ